MPNDSTPEASEFLLFQTEDGQTRIECRFEGETVWLSQNLMAELFQTTPQNITQHLKAIYQDAELDEVATCKDYLQVRQEGIRQVRRSVKRYSLDAILAVGYRVRSPRGSQFRQWATARLSEYLLKGFVVDYVGVGHHLKKAIDTYDERERKEIIDALGFPEEELRELQEAHAAVMALLQKHGLTDMNDHDAFYDVFYDEDLRFDFMMAFKWLTKSLNLLFPARQALDFMDDYKALAEINVLAGKHFRDQRLSMKGIPPKLRAITDAHLESRGIDIKIPPISILDEDFEKGVGERQRMDCIERSKCHSFECFSVSCSAWISQ